MRLATDPAVDDQVGTEARSPVKPEARRRLGWELWHQVSTPLPCHLAKRLFQRLANVPVIYFCMSVHDMLRWNIGACIRVDGTLQSRRYLNRFLAVSTLSKHGVEAQIPETYHIESVATLTV
jgi:hypothetical protein